MRRCDPFAMSGLNGEIKVVDLLGRGQSAAVPLAHLVAMTGWSDRMVRKKIETERRQGVPILSDNRSGYYLPASQEEAAACVLSLYHRAGEISRTARAIERATLAEVNGQIVLGGGEK